MTRILLTGCSGYIGSRIAIRIKQAGLELIATARNSNPALEQELSVSIMSIDVLKPISIERDNDRIDTIIHCATANDILSRNFEASVNLTIYGTRNVLEFALKHGIKRVIFFSTLQVYGTELNGEISEDTPVCCQTGYSLNHYYGEELCRMYTRKGDLDIVLLRPSNVFGVPDVSTVNRDSLVPMCFVKEILRTGKLTLNSSGRQQRNFISTNEVADMCLYLINNFPNGCNVVNLGSNWLCSIREVAEITEKIYLAKYQKNLHLNILSDEPKTSNYFSIKSKIQSLRPTTHESRQSMADVIANLFDTFNYERV